MLTCACGTKIWPRNTTGTCRKCHQRASYGKFRSQTPEVRNAKYALTHPKRIPMTPEEREAKRRVKCAATKEQRTGPCVKCGKTLIILGKGMCSTCYHKALEKPGTCADCGSYGPIKHKHKQLCYRCAIKLNNSKARPKHAAYYQANKKRINKQVLHRNHTVPQAMLSCRLRKKLCKVMKTHKQSASMLALLGCTLDFFTEHIRGLFTEGMSFDNYGKWHLDHIIPCTAWDLTNPEQQKMCFHYSNLRPAWALDNLSKWSKVPEWFKLEDYQEAFNPFKTLIAA